MFNDVANYYDYAASILDDEIQIKNTGGVALVGKPEVRGQQALLPEPLVHQNIFIDCLCNTVLPSKHTRNMKHANKQKN